MRKTIPKIVVAVVLVCLCAVPFAYSGFYPPTPRTKIFFLHVPGAVAQYGPDEDYIVVLAAVVISSTYGPFTYLQVEQGKPDVNGVWHYVDHWYTNNIFAGQKYALLYIRVNTDDTDVFDSYDVTMASIVVTSSSADQFSMSVSAWTHQGKISITAQFMADTSVDITPKLNGGLSHNNPGAQFNGVTARRNLSTPTITGVPFGGRTYNYDSSVFRYTRTELYDPSLLS